MNLSLNARGTTPGETKAMARLERRMVRSALEASLVERVYRRIAHVTDGDSGLSASLERVLVTEREGVALAWADALAHPTSRANALDDAWQEASVHFTATELADLTLLVTTILGWDKLARALHPLTGCSGGTVMKITR